MPLSPLSSPETSVSQEEGELGDLCDSLNQATHTTTVASRWTSKDGRKAGRRQSRGPSKRQPGTPKSACTKSRKTSSKEEEREGARARYAQLGPKSRTGCIALCHPSPSRQRRRGSTRGACQILRSRCRSAPSLRSRPLRARLNAALGRLAKAVGDLSSWSWRICNAT